MNLQDGYLSWTGNGPTWRVHINSVNRPIKSFYEETVLVAEHIWAKKQGKIHLCYSGGLDSEYVLAVFRTLGMPITPVIMRTQYNHHETQYAFKYCDENSIKPVVIDLDYDKGYYNTNVTNHDSFDPYLNNILNDFRIIQDSAKKIGVEIINTSLGSRISEILKTEKI